VDDFFRSADQGEVKTDICDDFNAQVQMAVDAVPPAWAEEGPDGSGAGLGAGMGAGMSAGANDILRERERRELHEV
jgi:hypothetical protein